MDRETKVIKALWLLLGAVLIGLILAAPVMRVSCHYENSRDYVINGDTGKAELQEVQTTVSE